MDMNWRNFRFIQYLKHIKKLYQKHQRLKEKTICCFYARLS